ncbi:MAG: hypothetical protein VW338_09730, partial [Rhodospirillaceae bacterium]
MDSSDDGHSSQQSRAEAVTQPLSAAITTMIWISMGGFSRMLVSSGLWPSERGISRQPADLGATSRRATMPANSGAG